MLNILSAMFNSRLALSVDQQVTLQVEQDVELLDITRLLVHHTLMKAFLGFRSQAPITFQKPIWNMKLTKERSEEVLVQEHFQVKKTQSRLLQRI
jgi:hypothetical protein